MTTDTTIPAADLQRLRGLAQTLRDLELRGEWMWRGNLSHGPSLQTRGNGGQYILGPATRHDHVTYAPEYDDTIRTVRAVDCSGPMCELPREWVSQEQVRAEASIAWTVPTGSYLALNRWVVDGKVPDPGNIDPDLREQMLAWEASDREGPTHPRDTSTLAFRVAGDGYARLAPADDIPIFEVCREATTETDPRVYRDDVVGFRSPVADYFAALNADLVIALLDELEQLRAQV